VSPGADDPRVKHLLETLERLAAGDLTQVVPISPLHDSLDAIGFGVNVLVDELRYSAEGLRSAKELAERDDRAKTLFVRNISHELRTPLTAILGLTQLLAVPEVDAARRIDLVARIHSNADALLALVDDLLDFSKIDAGKLPFEVAAIDPRELIAEVVRRFELQATGKGVRLAFEVAAGVPSVVFSDRRRVGQVLTNLIGNALKFTRRGSIDVRVSPASDDPTRLWIDVADTGIGLTQAQQESLFSPFQQADPGIPRTYGGHGLGLMLSRMLAEALGGGLTVASSAPGLGSTFRMTLAVDLRPAGGAAVVSPPAGGVSDAGALAGLELLLAEDNPDIMIAVHDVLEVLGARVTQAVDGREAMAHIAASRFDVVLMDVRMPVLDGLAATRLLRERGCRLPIIALTADAMPEHRQECLDAGFDDYLKKPIDWDELIARVRRVCGARARALP
jgi:signal transduction histidine kinase/CheY-like chemotaxis protein